MPSEDRRTVVICIGNELVADDAAGYEVYGRLVPLQLAARVRCCGVGGIDVLALLQGETDLIVVDAVQLGAAPGTVHVIPWHLLPENGAEISAHGLGLRETIEIGRILYPDQIPERGTLVGIEGRCFNRTREYMSREVSQAIDVAVATVKELVQGGAHG